LVPCFKTARDSSLATRSNPLLVPAAMGNCLKPASKHVGLGLTEVEEEESLAEVKRISQEEQAAEGLKVKIVLTRAELEWLVAQVNSGERRLEDVIHDMHAAAARGDKDGGGWRPRLESITEVPGD
jgi:hypothetical protein